MQSFIGGAIMIVIALLMIVYGRAVNGIPKEFLRSYPIGIAYIMTCMVLLVYGVAWIIMSIV